MPSNSTANVFGLVIHGLDAEEVVSRIETQTESGKYCWIVTANPEILLEAKRNPRYWETIRSADLRLVDGFGLQLVGWLFGSSLKRVTGVDLSEAIIAHSERRNWSVVLLGGKNGAADRAAWQMRQRHPRLRISSYDGGSVTKEGVGDEQAATALSRLIREPPDILLVGFGHPKQEEWISKNAGNIPGLKAAMGVGGTFDYWAGIVNRAPKIFRLVGLEWLWRLIHEPTRIKRIFRAVIVFPLLAIRDRIRL
jgi:N-acetylglucosaminyldiphosphoundecaprenol N-acetyl-beta-D-mannosaminyltransferase